MEDDKFRDLMQHSKLEIQFPGFEDKVMEQIKLKEESQKSVWKNLKISWIFFIMGTFLGIFGSQYLTNLEIPLLKQNSQWFILIVEILIVIVIISQFDKLIYFTFKKRE